MGYINKSRDGRWGLPVGMIALILGLVLFGSVAGPGPALAAQITCGLCHSIPPQTSDNGGCKQTTKNHPEHGAPNDSTACTRCHPNAGAMGAPSSTHYNGLINVTSTSVHYNSGTSQCSKACHTNKTATWGQSVDCNICHYRNGPVIGGYAQMSGLHVTPHKTWGHYSSAIKVQDNTKTVTCTNCHPPGIDFQNDTTTPFAHIKESYTSNFNQRADMSTAFQNVTVTGVGYRKGATIATGTCAASCHYNASDPFWNYTIYFKAGQAKRFGPYSTARWSANTLKCNECHSTPSQEATLGTTTSIFHTVNGPSWNANNRHYNHMFKYKLNPFNFSGQDRNIYCDDCHRTPNINAVRGFRNHSTLGQGRSKVISLPVKSQNSRVYLLWRNNGIGRDGVTMPNFTTVNGMPSCTNIYCHTVMVTGQWAADSCNTCHGKLNGVDLGSGAPGYVNTTTTVVNTHLFEDYSGGGGAHYSHVMKRGYPCRTCHTGGGDTVPNHYANAPLNADGTRKVLRSNVKVQADPAYWFNNVTSSYNWTTRSCDNVKCHFGSSQNWDCAPLH